MYNSHLNLIPNRGASMKILIAVDMEGISGVTGWHHVLPDKPEYSRGRQWMTDDVNAAVEGAFQAGANEVVVTDGHWDGSNILIESLDPRASLINGSPSPLSMVQGVNDGMDAVMFIGYHARAGTKYAILDHTWSSGRVDNLWLNGTLAGEIALNAAVCGSFGVPVVAISGDQSACAEAASLIPGIHSAQVKKANGRMNAECLPLQRAHDLITAIAKDAVEKRTKINPYVLPGPVTVAVEFYRSDMADWAEGLPGSRRVDARKVEYVGENILTASQAFRSMVALAQF
jgi:D-amino peptidase